MEVCPSVMAFGHYFLACDSGRNQDFKTPYVNNGHQTSQYKKVYIGLISQKNRERFPRIITLASFRLDYEYEIEYEHDFSILVFRLHIITTHTQFIPLATLST